MEFICSSLKFKKIPGFLDSEEKVSEARRQLENSTKDVFEELRIARMNSYFGAREIVLD